MTAVAKTFVMRTCARFAAYIVAGAADLLLGAMFGRLFRSIEARIVSSSR